MPGASPQNARYNVVAMGLHWAVAALIIGNIGVAWYFGALPRLEQIPSIQIHKSIGITVLILSVIRLAWRFTARPPAEPPSLRGWERLASNLTYVLFYLLMIGLPLTGWIYVTASGLITVYPVTLFGLVTMPTLTAITSLPHDQMEQVKTGFQAAHQLLAKVAYVLIALHVAAALRHWIILRDGIAQRMIPFLSFPRARP